MENNKVEQVRFVTQQIQLFVEKRHGRQIQHLVAGRLRNYRYVPKLRFVPELTEMTHSDVVLHARRQLRK